jgi:hypothetical protein
MNSAKKLAGTHWRRVIGGAVVLAAGIFSGTASAGMYNDGKVFLTGGVFTVDGAGGGGAVPWATITGYETRDGINGGIGFTYVSLPNYTLNFLGASVGFFDRFELSYMDTTLTTNLSNVDTVGLLATALGIEDNLGIEAHGSNLGLHTYGAKLRLFGDAVYTSDSFLPQVAIGGLYKKNTNEKFVATLGGADYKDWEAYAAFTKVFFRYSTLVNITARYTAANQIGLTGFGSCKPNGECDDDKEFRFEFSTAYLLQKNFAIGGEYQQHGDNTKGQTVNLNGVTGTNAVGDLLSTVLAGAITNVGGLSDSLVQSESDWFDFFMAYAPNKNFSLVMAYLFLGDIAVADDQNGLYVALHATF